MKIHFVCLGNSFRSRMAEAYLNSKIIPNLEVSSSGTLAEKNLNGPIAWYSARIIKNNRLVPFMSNFWKQTTKELIQKSNLIIFMEEECYLFCKDFLLPEQKYELWNIQDLIGANNPGLENEIEKIKESEGIFNQIKQKTDLLIK